MTPREKAVDAALVLMYRLPDEWELDVDGPCVHGSAEGYGSGAHSAGPGEVPASFTIRADHRGDDGLWRASWSRPNSLRGGLHDPVADVGGVRERVLAWVVGRADDLEEDRGRGRDRRC
jgi:hypothetical protein